MTRITYDNRLFILTILLCVIFLRDPQKFKILVNYLGSKVKEIYSLFFF